MGLMSPEMLGIRWRRSSAMEPNLILQNPETGQVIVASQ